MLNIIEWSNFEHLYAPFQIVSDISSIWIMYNFIFIFGFVPHGWDHYFGTISDIIAHILRGVLDWELLFWAAIEEFVLYFLIDFLGDLARLILGTGIEQVLRAAAVDRAVEHNHGDG